MQQMLSGKDANSLPSGRASRASNMSTMSRATNQPQGEADGTAKQDVVDSAAIRSMLRSSTEMGNLGGAMGDGIGVPSRTSQRRGTNSRMSTASSMSNYSTQTNRQHRQRPSSSSAARHSAREFPDTLSPTTMLSGSSPLVPYQGPRDRDSHRSSSITNSMPQPAFRIASNRSTGNLRTHEPMPRSKSPYGPPPNRYLRPAHRSASPAWNEMPGTNNRRIQTHTNQGQAYPPGQMRSRAPSDASLANSDRGYNAPQHPGYGMSGTYYDRRGDQSIPPLPSIDPRYKQHVAPVRQANFVAPEQRRIQRSIKGSASSGSTNMRTDSDTPSSDMALPPTPKDGMSTNMLSSPPGIRMARDTTNRMMKHNTPSSPAYYDGSEQFEDMEYVEPEAERVPTGFVSHSKTVIEERAYNVASGPAQLVSSFKKSAESESFGVPTIAELPASPVGQRITRELVRKGLDAPSTTGDAASPGSSPPTRNSMVTSRHTHDQAMAGRIDDEPNGSSVLTTGPDETLHSVLSQTGSSLANSSTIDFAVRYSIPAMTGNGSGGDHDTGSQPPSTVPGSPEKNTDDGMSELLAGYQHTDTKQESGGVPITAETPQTKGSESASTHAHQSSDEQSFKSCTDVPDPGSAESEEDVEDSPKPLQNVSSESQLPEKDSDARSFQTAKDVATPARTNSMPPSRLPSSNLDVELQPKRPVTGSSSSFQVLRKPLPTGHDSVVSSSSKLGASSKPSINQGLVSMSGSSSTLSASQQPPAVPPRESSASAEAQRHNAVGLYLLRKVGLPFRGSKGKKVAVDENALVEANTDTPLSQPMQHSESIPVPIAPVRRSIDAVAIEKVLETQNIEAERQTSSIPVEYHNSSNDLRVGLTLIPAVHHHSFSSPVTGFPEPSSVYSPQDISLKGRTYSSPAGVPVSPEDSRRDSQSTTHLSWASRKPYGVPPASTSEPRLALPSVQEDTTTDLRLSVYKYNAPQRYLHDLKEDSHEDSSLNTSASNLKNSHFRFPLSAGFGMRTSFDDAIVLRGKSSAGSRRASVIKDVHGLPFLEFSEANLYDKFKNALPEGVRFSRSSAQAQLDVTEVVEGSLRLVATDNGLDGNVQGLANVADQNEALQTLSDSTGVIDFTRFKRHYSSERLMAEIDRVSIPSITGLTQRVGEMLPSLSLAGHHEQDESGGEAVEFPEEEDLMEHAIEEIQHVHPPSQKRSSARLRPVRGSPTLMVIEDDVFEEITSKERGTATSGDPCVGPLKFEAEVGEAGTRDKGKGKATTHTPTRQLSTVIELQTPLPAVLRPEARIVTNQVLRRSVESTFSSLTKSPSSFVSTPTATDTRPWNSDKNYPWATTTNPSVNISLPPQAALKQSPRPGPSHLRNALSDATSSTFTSLHTPTTSPYDKASASNTHRQSHRLSIFGRGGDQAHAVGERYPTSALSPPTAIFRDHLSTCDTSDDEDFTISRKSNKLTLRKRFSSAARSSTLTHTTPRATRSKANPAELASPASAHENSSSTLQDRLGEARAFTSNRHTFRDAQGMPIGAYHRHRIVDSIKRWWHKGGDLIRTISRRSSSRRDVVRSSN